MHLASGTRIQTQSGEALSLRFGLVSHFVASVSSPPSRAPTSALSTRPSVRVRSPSLHLCLSLRLFVCLSVSPSLRLSARPRTPHPLLAFSRSLPSSSIMWHRRSFCRRCNTQKPQEGTAQMQPNRLMLTERASAHMGVWVCSSTSVCICTRIHAERLAPTAVARCKGHEHSS